MIYKYQDQSQHTHNTNMFSNIPVILLMDSPYKNPNVVAGTLQPSSVPSSQQVFSTSPSLQHYAPVRNPRLFSTTKSKSCLTARCIIYTRMFIWAAFSLPRIFRIPADLFSRALLHTYGKSLVNFSTCDEFGLDGDVSRCSYVSDRLAAATEYNFSYDISMRLSKDLEDQPVSR